MTSLKLNVYPRKIKDELLLEWVKKSTELKYTQTFVFFYFEDFPFKLTHDIDTAVNKDLDKLVNLHSSIDVKSFTVSVPKEEVIQMLHILLYILATHTPTGRRHEMTWSTYTCLRMNFSDHSVSASPERFELSLCTGTAPNHLNIISCLFFIFPPN